MSLPSEPGVYFIEREEYERLPRINWSLLKHIGKSPAHFNAARLSPFEDSDAKKRGRAIHLAVHEPDQFRAKCVVFEGKARAGKDWEAFVARNPDSEILTPNMHETALTLSRIVRSHPVARKYVSGGKGEVTVLWVCRVPALGEEAAFEVPCKSRIDFVGDFGGLVDLKSCADASREGFARTCWNLGYHVQAAFYVDAYEAATGERRPYFFVAAEAKPPHCVTVFRVPGQILELGRARYRELLALYRRCTANSSWPEYADDVVELELPRWAMPYDDGVEDLGLTIGGAPAIGFGT